MKPPLAITGCALLTPLDEPGRDTWQAIAADHRVEQRVRIDDGLLDPDVRWDRSIRLGMTAAGQALRRRSLGPDTALFCGTSKGPISVMLHGLEQFRRGESLSESDARQIAWGAGAMGTVIADQLGITSVHTSVAACASGLHALHRAAQALWRGECPRALVVAADASLHPLFDASFARLGVLAPPDDDGIRRCAPFDPQGTGFFPAEAAAALLLETIPSEHPLAWLDTSWIGADGTDLIAIDPRTRALRTGLSHASTDALRKDLAFIHAHATGTAHDAYELDAIRAALGPDVPVFSHKRWLGHSLGAAGLVAIAISVMCHRRRQLPTGEPLLRGSTSLTIAQGFGGHIGVVALRG